MRIRRTELSKNQLVIEHLCPGGPIDVAVGAKQTNMPLIGYDGKVYTPDEAKELARSLILAADLAEGEIEIAL